MPSQTSTQTTPEQWFTDYAAGNYYAMLSLTDYIALRRSGGSLSSHPISLAVA